VVLRSSVTSKPAGAVPFDTERARERITGTFAERSDLVIGCAP
jgi:hypothetical protein